MGQTGIVHPTPQSLPSTQNFDFSHDHFENPDGWVGWSISLLETGLTPTGNVRLIAPSDASIITAGIHNYDGKFGFQGHMASLATAVNSLGFSNVRISFDVMTIRNPYNESLNNTRINQVLLQYRLGTEGSFTLVPGFLYSNGTEIQVTGTTGQNIRNVLVNLPPECANAPVLQLRWVSTRLSGSGDYPSFAVDNVYIEGYHTGVTGLGVSPANLDYGVKVMHTVTDQTVRITNNRRYPTQISTPEITIASSAAYTVHHISEVVSSITLDPGEYIDVIVRFNPTEIGDHVGELQISEVSEPPVYVGLTGFCDLPGDVDFILSDRRVDFGTVQLNVVARHPVGITNAGSDPGEITDLILQGDPEFMIPDPITLPKVIYPGQLWEFDIGYLPTMLGVNQGTLQFGGSLGFNEKLALTGTGFDAPQPIISASPNPMEKSMLEQSVSAENLIIHNSGAVPLNFTVDIAGIRPWLRVGSTAGTVAPGESMPITLIFNTYGVAPSPMGGYTAYYTSLIVLNSDDLVNPSLVVTVYLNVTPMPIFVDFTATALGGICPLAVSFTDLSRLSGGTATATITGWRWDFQNDGMIDSFTQHPVYTYQTPGFYSVKLTIYTSTGGIYSRIKTDYIEVINNPPMVFNPLDTIGDMFEDEVWGPYSALNIFYDSDGHLMTFGAINSTNIFVNFTGHLFTLSSTRGWHGIETIVLIASDSYGGTASHPVTVTTTAVNDPPVIIMPDELYFIRNSHLTVNFADYINDPDNTDDEISIEVVSIGAASLITVDYQPNQPGELTAVFGAPPDWFGSGMFRVTANDHMRRTIYIKEFEVVVLEYFTVQFGTDVASDIAPTVYQYTGQTVNFRDRTLGNPDWFLWDFGDGNTSNERNPSHAYLSSGTYNVMLTLRNLEAGIQSTASYTFFSMFTFSGTPVYDVSTVQNWTDPSYNIFGDVTFDEDTDIGDENTSVELIIFSQTPMNILANFNLNRVTMRPPAGSQYWGGLNFGVGSLGSLLNTNLIGARKPLRMDGANPQIFNLMIAPKDPDELLDGIGIEIYGDSSPNLNDVEITNYRSGIFIDVQGRNRTTTPTLTNTRVRNTTQGSRTGGERTTGIKVTGDVDVTMDDIDVEDYDLGIEIKNEASAYTTTPTLTNTRVRNSTQGSRPGDQGTVGLKIAGNVGVIIDAVEISGVEKGIIMQNGTTSGHLTPTLTNTRVRNSTQGSRSTSTGIAISGDVVLVMEDCDIDDYDFGISYIGDGSMPRSTLTPTLTNTRVRNSTQGSRFFSTGLVLTDIPRIKIDQGLIDGYHAGIEITGTDLRSIMTPTLTNTRVRNSTQSSRTENIGIFLGSGVLGRVENTTVESAGIGILVADGNGTLLKKNTLKNCEIGIRGSGILPVLPIHRHVFILTDDYFMEYPNQNYRALDLHFTGPWVVTNNTISGYIKAITANDANITFVNNILWGSSMTSTPFDLLNSMIIQNYNNIGYDSGIYPGVGNINANPLFINAADDNFNLHYDSPCIDAGSPLIPPDQDGTVSDIGAFVYLHRAAFTSSARFITVGTVVQFLNQSVGHDHPATVTMWDLNNDGHIDGLTRNWSFQFNEPGWYDLRLKMQTGNLEDEIAYDRLIIVQLHHLKPPENVQLSVDDGNLLLQWDAVTQTIDNLPIDVNYYLIYTSDKPDGIFRFRTYTEAPIISHSEALDPVKKQMFFFVIGFSGSRTALMDFIDQNRDIGLQKHNMNKRMEIRISKPN